MSATLRCQEGILKFEMNLKQKVLLLLSLQTEGSKTSKWKISQVYQQYLLFMSPINNNDKSS